MSVRNRMVLSAVTAGVVMALLAGCAVSGGGGAPSSNPASSQGSSDPNNPFGVSASAPLEVVIFKGGFGDDYAKYVESLYTKAFPGATITHNGVQKIQDVLQPRFVAGNPPDVVDNSGPAALNLATLQQSGQLMDLQQLLDAPSVDDPSITVGASLLPGGAGDLGNSIVAINYAYTVYGFWYNQDLFAQHGWTYPQTWDELLALCAKMKAAGIAPFTYQGKYPSYFVDPLMQMIGKAGGMQAVLDIDNLTPNAWRAQPVVDSVNAIEQLVTNGYILPGSEGLSHTESQQAWIDGEAALIPCGSWLENEMKSTLPSGFRMAVGATPSVTAHDVLPAGAIEASASESFIVPKDGKNAAGGQEFLRQMLSKAAASKFSELTGSLTTVKGAGADVTNSPGLTSSRTAVAAAGDNIVNFRFAGWYGDMYNTISTAMGELLAGRITAADFIDRAQAAADKTASDPDVVKYHR